MNLDDFSKDLLNNIDKYDENLIKEQIIDFTKQVLEAHMNSESIKVRNAIIEGNLKGNPPRPILLCSVGISALAPEQVAEQVKSVSGSLNASIPPTEYIVIIKTNDSTENTLEVLSVAKLTKKQQLEVIDKISKLEDYINENHNIVTKK